MKFPVLQVALDFVDMERAVKAAKGAVKGGCDWIEAGTPLIKAEGLDAVRALKKLFPGRKIIADMKVMDAGRIEVEAAAKAGADIICVLAAATDHTIKECVEAAKNYGAEIEADLIAVENAVSRAKQLEEMGVNYIGVHCSIDEQMHGQDKFDLLKKIHRTVRIPLAIAGGINSETAYGAVKAGADIIIAGGSITKAECPDKAAKDIKKAITQKIKVATKYFKRVAESDVIKIFNMVSTSNVSDAMHRQGVLQGIAAVQKGLKMAGKVLTVRTYPGDWSKTVQAVDIAEPGDVIVVDSGGVGPAVWGELATHGAIQKKLGGVVIDGAVRDTVEIMKLKFPVFAKLKMPNCGEPKGFGEIGIPVTLSGQKVFPGDWAVGDDDGVCIIPKDKTVEIANRAMSVLEAENRIRKEIDDGSTLGKVVELLKWEKQK